jgi:hypothetical protein
MQTLYSKRQMTLRLDDFYILNEQLMFPFKAVKKKIDHA